MANDYTCPWLKEPGKAPECEYYRLTHSIWIRERLLGWCEHFHKPDTRYDEKWSCTNADRRMKIDQEHKEAKNEKKTRV